MQPFISVVVPVLNRANMIGSLLDSLLRQDYPKERYEIIVVDNGSSDGTPHVVERYPVRLLEETRRCSAYVARNRGIEASRGTLIAFTDSDCVAASNWLRALVAGWNDLEFGAFAGQILGYAPRTLVARFLTRRWSIDYHNSQIFPYLPYAPTGNVAYRRRIFELVGSFDEALPSGGDTDLAWRMQEQTAYRIAYRPEAVVYHRHESTVWGMFQQYARYGEGVGHLELLHPKLYERASHRWGRLSGRRVIELLAPLVRGKYPAWMEPSSWLAALTFPFLEAIRNVAFDRGIRKGRRTSLATLEVNSSNCT